MSGTLFEVLNFYPINQPAHHFQIPNFSAYPNALQVSASGLLGIMARDQVWLVDARSFIQNPYAPRVGWSASAPAPLTSISFSAPGCTQDHWPLLGASTEKGQILLYETKKSSWTHLTVSLKYNLSAGQAHKFLSKLSVGRPAVLTFGPLSSRQKVLCLVAYGRYLRMWLLSPIREICKTGAPLLKMDRDIRVLTSLTNARYVGASVHGRFFEFNFQESTGQLTVVHQLDCQLWGGVQGLLASENAGCMAASGMHDLSLHFGGGDDEDPKIGRPPPLLNTCLTAYCFVGDCLLMADMKGTWGIRHPETSRCQPFHLGTLTGLGVSHHNSLLFGVYQTGRGCRLALLGSHLQFAPDLDMRVSQKLTKGQLKEHPFWDLQEAILAPLWDQRRYLLGQFGKELDVSAPRFSDEGSLLQCLMARLTQLRKVLYPLAPQPPEPIDFSQVWQSISAREPKRMAGIRLTFALYMIWIKCVHLLTFDPRRLDTPEIYPDARGFPAYLYEGPDFETRASLLKYFLKGLHPKQSFAKRLKDKCPACERTNKTCELFLTFVCSQGHRVPCCNATFRPLTRDFTSCPFCHRSFANPQNFCLNCGSHLLGQCL